MSDTDQKGVSRDSAASTHSRSPQVDEAPASSADPLGDVRQDLRHVRREVESVAGEVKEEAEAQIERAKHGTASFAGKQKDAAARQLSGIAAALRQTSEGLSSDQPEVAGYARSIAGSVERMSRRLDKHDVDTLVGMAEDFGRRQPASLLGIAALAGFLSGRFLLASGKRRGSRAGEATRSLSLRTTPSSAASHEVAGSRRSETNG